MRERLKLWIRYVPEVGEYMRKEKKDEISMCWRQGNTCEKRKKMKQVCAEAREHMRKEKKDEIGMCQRRGNTCERGGIMDQVCARGKRIHARKGKIKIK